ncbi:MAG: amino acid ABC transporter [Hyphomicrobiales bacterium]|nr:MAG: amino acid ABC transporter [Hyphomicrobiales bacterium]
MKEILEWNFDSRAGLDCEWVQNDWDSIIPNLVSVTTIQSYPVCQLQLREMRLLILHKIIFNQIHRHNNTGDGNKAAYIGVVAAQTATIQASHVAESGAILAEFATPDETISALRNGEVEAVMADKSFLAPIVAESNGGLKFIGQDVYIGGGVGMGIRESDSDLKDTFDAAIDSMKADGSLNTLIEKWFGDEASLF